MVVLGIDPGLERVGIGVIERTGSKIEPIHYGLILTERVAIRDRLVAIHDQLDEIIQRYRPDAYATEALLFAANRKTAMDVAKALGVILYVGGKHGLDWAEYSPPQVKLAVVGNGGADKKQVQFMVTKMLGLAEPPHPDDVADALAVAICHALHSRANLPKK